MKFKVVHVTKGNIIPADVYLFNSPEMARREVERANNREDPKHHYWASALLDICGGERAVHEYWGITIDPEPEVNEWGEVGL